MSKTNTVLFTVLTVILVACSKQQPEAGMNFKMSVSLPELKDENNEKFLSFSLTDGDRLTAVVDEGFYPLQNLKNGSFGSVSLVPEEGRDYSMTVVKARNAKISEPIDGICYPVIQIPASDGFVVTQSGAGSVSHLGELPLYGGVRFNGGDAPKVALHCPAAVLRLTLDNDTKKAVNVTSLELGGNGLALSGTFRIDGINNAVIPVKTLSKVSMNVDGCSVAAGKSAVLYLPFASLSVSSATSLKLTVGLDGSLKTYTLKVDAGSALVGGRVWNRSLSLSSGGSGEGDRSGASNGNSNGYLVNFEVPHADVDLAAKEPFSSFVNEINGGSGAKAYIYETGKSGTRIVTHTFVNGNRKFRNYTFLYDYEKHCPIWLVYPMNSGYCSTSGSRTKAWKYDPAIPQDAQPNLSSSYDFPYNRGHMLASHSRAGVANANTQTFYFTNMTPQNSSNFNTGGAVWNALEDAEKAIVPSGRDTLYVVTGCIFDSGWKTANANGVSCPVPTRFYKAFMMCRFDNSGKIQSATSSAFLMPHETDGKTANYNKYKLTVDELEKVIGYDLFANVPDAIQNPAEASCGFSL